jgi:hypothetical protein
MASTNVVSLVLPAAAAANEGRYHHAKRLVGAPVDARAVCAVSSTEVLETTLGRWRRFPLHLARRPASQRGRETVLGAAAAPGWLGAQCGCGPS